MVFPADIATALQLFSGAPILRPFGRDCLLLVKLLTVIGILAMLSLIVFIDERLFEGVNLRIQLLGQ